MTNENARKEVASENKEFLEAISYLVDFLEVKRYVLACVARHGYLAKRYNSENYFGMYDVLCLRSEKGDTKLMFDKIWANLEEEYGSHMRKIDSDMSVPEMLSDTTKAYSWSRERKKVPNLEEVKNTCEDFWNRMKVFEDDVCQDIERRDLEGKRAKLLADCFLEWSRTRHESIRIWLQQERIKWILQNTDKKERFRSLNMYLAKLMFYEALKTDLEGLLASSVSFARRLLGYMMHAVNQKSDKEYSLKLLRYGVDHIWEKVNERNSQGQELDELFYETLAALRFCVKILS